MDEKERALQEYQAKTSKKHCLGVKKVFSEVKQYVLKTKGAKASYSEKEDDFEPLLEPKPKVKAHKEDLQQGRCTHCIGRRSQSFRLYLERMPGKVYFKHEQRKRILGYSYVNHHETPSITIPEELQIYFENTRKKETQAIEANIPRYLQNNYRPVNYANSGVTCDCLMVHHLFDSKCKRCEVVTAVYIHVLRNHDTGEVFDRAFVWNAGYDVDFEAGPDENDPVLPRQCAPIRP